jgi:hypothetical protein
VLERDWRFPPQKSKSIINMFLRNVGKLLPDYATAKKLVLFSIFVRLEYVTTHVFI